jgi:hypothetical protein
MQISTLKICHRCSGSDGFWIVCMWYALRACWTRCVLPARLRADPESSWCDVVCLGRKTPMT